MAATEQPLVTRKASEIIRSHRLQPAQMICLLLYYAVAVRLPNPPLPGGALANACRIFLCKRIFKRAGRNFKVAAGANFGTGAGLEIGDNSALNVECWIANDTVIGSDVMMGPRVSILSGSHNFADTTRPMREQGAPLRQPVIIGDDVWIGTQSIILPGVHVGDHAIIGAGSVVTKDVLEWSIIAGNPARVIRSRLNGISDEA